MFTFRSQMLTTAGSMPDRVVSKRFLHPHTFRVLPQPHAAVLRIVRSAYWTRSQLLCTDDRSDDGRLGWTCWTACDSGGYASADPRPRGRTAWSTPSPPDSGLEKTWIHLMPWPQISRKSESFKNNYVLLCLTLASDENLCSTRSGQKQVEIMVNTLSRYF